MIEYYHPTRFPLLRTDTEEICWIALKTPTPTLPQREREKQRNSQPRARHSFFFLQSPPRAFATVREFRRLLRIS